MKRRLLIGVAIMTTLRLFGQNDPTDTMDLSLNEAIEYAVQNNLNAKNSRLDLISAKQRIWETAAQGLPQASASVNYNNNISLATTLIPDFFGDPSEKIEIQFGTKHFATAGISGSQLLFSGQYIVGLQAAKLFKDFTSKNLQLSEQQVKEAIVQSYYLVLLADNTLQALRGNLSNFQKTFEETQELFKAGFIEEINVDQLEVTMMDLENAILSLERQQVAAEYLLKYQMGLELTQGVVLTDKLIELIESLEYELLVDLNFNLESNINYQILQDQEQLALMDMKMKRSEYLPTLSAFYSLDFSAQRDEFNFLDGNENWYKANAVGLSFNLPLFSSGMRVAGVAQKKIAYEKASNTREFAARGLEVEFLQAKYDLSNAFEKLTRERKNLELSKKLISVTEIKYSEGISSSLDLTQINDQYLQTLSSYTSAMVDLLNAKLKMDILLNNI